MKFKKVILLCVFILALMTLGVASAGENQTDIVSNSTPEVEKIADYDYKIENMPEGNVSTFSQPVTVSELPYDAGGNITMSIDDVEKYNKEVSPIHNQLFLDDLNLAFGKHQLSVRYTGDDKYDGFIRNSTFLYSYISFNVSDEIYLGNYDHDCIKITYVDNIKGNIKLTVDGKTYYSSAITKDEIEDFQTSIGLEELSYGIHNYTITYSNGNYKPVTQKGSFKLDYYLNIYTYDEPVYYGDELYVEISHPYNGDDNLTFLFNGNPVTIENWGDFAATRLNDLKIGENIISYTYSDEEHPERTVIKKIFVLPKLTAPKTVGYNANESIILEVPKDISGTLTVKINNDVKTADIMNGKASISLNGLKPGTYNITITSDLTDDISYSLTVKPNIVLSEKIWIENIPNIIFIAPEDYNGILKIRELGNFTVENGYATVPLGNLKTGPVTLDIAYDDYSWEYVGYVYDENPNSAFAIYCSDTYNIHADYSIYFSLSDFLKANGKLAIYVDDKFFEEYNVETFHRDEDSNVEGIRFENITLGNHTLKFVYSGDDYYKAFNETKNFECVEVDIMLSQQDIDDSMENEICVCVPIDDEGTITVNMDGELYDTREITPDSEYEGSLKFYYIPLTDYRTHEIEVIYSGKYGTISKNATINVNYVFYTTLNEYYTYGEENTFYIVLPEDALKTPTIYIDGVKYAFEEEIDISKLKPGNHTAVVTYPGDRTYPKKVINETFRVTGKIMVNYDYEEPYNICYNDPDESVSLMLPGDATGNLTLYIGEKYGRYEFYKTQALKKGYASIPLPSSKVGTYYIKAIYNGNYEVDDFELKIYVYPEITYPSAMFWSQNKYLTLKTSYVENGRLIITKAFGPDYADVKFSGNEVKVSLSKLDIDYYEYDYLEAHFFVDGIEMWTNSVDIVVKPLTKLVGGKNINAYYTDTVIYSLKVYGPYGKLVGKNEVVNVKVGSKNHKLKTDKNGVVKIKLANTPGTYTIKATYKGVTVKNTLKVKQILTLKTVKVKKSAKKLVLTATLKKGKKALKNKRVTFKFNGKTYKAKTNKKGIAKVTVKKSTLKKLKKGKTVKYQVTYLKTTVKKTAKVKK